MACTLVLELAGCGRTALESGSARPNAAALDAATALLPEVARDQRSAEVRASKWAGFVLQANYASAGNSIAAGDFDDDGAVDVVVAFWGNGVGNGRASVYRNRGDGTLAPPLTYDTTIEAQSVAVGDFSGDRKLDFVVTNGMEDLDLFVNLGDGSFAPRRLHGPEAVVVMASADFNRDGHPDLAFTTQDRSIDVVFGDVMGRFSPPLTYATGPIALSLAVSDLNRDGRPDLVAANTDFAGTCPPGLCLPSGLTGGGVNVFLNRGDGTFGPGATYSAGNGTAAVAAGDLDGDGAPDVAATNSVDDTLSVFFNAGDGSFGPPAIYANAGSGTSALGEPYPPTGGGVAAADFDGDGHVDLAVVRGAQSGRNGSVLVFVNPGDGRFGPPFTSSVTGSPRGFAVADYNRDGLPDLAVVMDDSSLAMLLSTYE